MPAMPHMEPSQSKAIATTASLSNVGTGIAEPYPSSLMEHDTFALGGDRRVSRLGFGAMRVAGPGVWGEPADRTEAIATLRRAVELGGAIVDTADSYGPC